MRTTWMRGALVGLVFVVGCAVAIDDFERCEALTYEVERNSCEGDVASCTLACRSRDTEEERVACVRRCGPDSPCVECIFNILFECAIEECQESYQDLSCCSLDRCGAIDFECEACPSEIDAFGECVSSSVTAGAACDPELVRECYAN